MKIADCDIIQDLLPGYSDKITSISTNKLVEKHLQECEKCNLVLKNMNQNINDEILDNQDNQIDYLKGYRKRRKILIIVSIIVTIMMLATIFTINILNKNIILDRALYMDVNKFNVEYMYTKENEGRDITAGTTFKYKTLEVYLYSEEYKNMYLTGSYETNLGDKEIYYKISAKELPQGVEFDGSGMDTSFHLDDRIEKIYLEDTKHQLKEIWNKDMKVMSEEEWRKWYIDDYVPKEIIDLYHMDYNTIPVATSIWKHVYNHNLENTKR